LRGRIFLSPLMEEGVGKEEDSGEYVFLTKERG
jgi:hypothetical protein